MTRCAFVIGSNGSNAFDPLRYAFDDACRVAETLSGERYGFSVTSPPEILDPYTIKRELDMLAKSCQPDDVFLFFFSGHGELIAGELMLVLDGTVPGDVTTYLPVSWVKEARARCAANRRLLILDCCHAGAAAGGKSGDGVDLVDLGVDVRTEVMLLASRRLERAREFEHLKGSFLTAELCSFLEANHNETVGLSELMDCLHRAAIEHNKRVLEKVSGFVNLPTVPFPFLHGEQQGEFIFTRAICPDLSRYVTVHSMRSLNTAGEPAIASMALVTAMEASLAAKGIPCQLSIRYVKEMLRKTMLRKREKWEAEWVEPALYSAEFFGVPLESYWPFAPGRRGRPRITKDNSADGMRWFKAKVFRLQGLDDIPEQLNARRPVLAQLLIHEHNGWYDIGGKGVIVVPKADDTIIDGTVVTLVAKGNLGYRFANNWGREWAEDGFGWITEEAAKRLIEDLWAIEAFERK